MKKTSTAWEISKIFAVFLIAALSVVSVLRIKEELDNAELIIKERLEKVIGREISISRVRVNILGYVALDDVEIAKQGKLEDGKSLDCRRIVIWLNLFKYLFNKQPIERNISKIVFHEPFLSLHMVGENQGFAPAIPITCEVVIKSGRAEIEYGSLFSFEDIRGSFKLDDGKDELKFTASARTGQNRGSRIKVDGVWHKDEYAINLSVKNAELKEYFELLTSKSRFEIKEGIGDFHLILNKQKGQKKVFCSGNLFLKNGRMGLKDSSYLVNILGGEIHFNGDRVNCKNLALKYGDSEFRVSGIIDDFLKASPGLSFSADSSIELADIPGIVKGDWIKRIEPLKGKGRMEVTVSGSLDAPVCSGSLSLEESLVAGIKIDNLETRFGYADRVIDMQGLKIGLYQGVFNGNGRADLANPKDPYLNLDFNLDGMNFALIPILKEPHKGRLNFKAKLSGRVDDLQCNGNMNVSKLEIGEYSLGSVSGPFSYRNGRFKAGVNENEKSFKLNLDCLWSKGERRLDLKECRVAFRDGGSFELDGSVSMGEADELNVRASLEKIMVNRFPFLKRIYPDIDGMFDFNGYIKGSIQFPSISGLLTAKNITVNKTDVSIEADFSYSDRVLTVKACNINDSYFGDLLFDLTGEKPRVSGKMKCIDAEMKVALNLIPFKIKKDISGVLNGDVEFDGPLIDKSLKASGRITVDDMVIGESLGFREVASDFSIRDEELIITQFSCINEQGRIDGDAKVGLRRDAANKFTIKTQWKDFVVSSSTPMPVSFNVSGDCNYSGKLYISEKWKTEISGYVSSSNLTVNEEPVEEIKTRVSYKNNVINVSSLSMGESVQGKAILSLKKPATISSSIKVKYKDIPGFINSFLRQKFVCEGGILGELTGSISVSGKLDNPVMEGVFRIRDGKFRSKDMGFRWNSKFKYSDKILAFETARLRFVKPYGSIKVTGMIDFNSEFPFNLDGVLENVPVDVLEDVLIDYPEIAGKVDGSVYIRGDFNNPILRADLVSENNTIFGYKFKNLKTKVRFQGPALHVDSLSAEFGQSIIRLGRNSVVTRRAEKKYGFSLPVHLRNAGIKGLSLFGELKLEGTADFSGEKNKVNSEVTIRDLWINQWNIAGIKTRFEFKDGVARYVYPGKETKFWVKVDLNDPGILKIENVEIYEGRKKILDVRGKVNLDNGFIEGRMKTSSRGVRMHVLGELLNFEKEQDGFATFNISMAGHWLEVLSGSKKYSEEKPSVSGVVEIEDGNIRYLDFDKLRASFVGDAGKIDLKYLQVMKTGKYVIDVSGSLPYEIEEGKSEEEHKLKLKVYGENSMQFLTLFMGNVIDDCEGVLDGMATITGSISKPVINGYLKGEKGVFKKRVNEPYLGSKVTNVTVKADIKDNKMVIRTFRGKMGDVIIDVSGSMSYTGSSIMDFDLDMVAEGGKGIPVESHVLTISAASLLEVGDSPSKGNVKGSLHAYGNTGSFQIDGELELNDTIVTYPVPAKHRDREKSDFFRPALWNIKLTAGENVIYTKQYVSARIKGGIDITGNTNDLEANGRIQALDGDIYYLNSNYMLKEASIDVVDNKITVQGRAETKIPDDTITMVIEKSSFPDLKVRFVSLNDPEMSSEDASLKVAGMYYKDSTENERMDLIRQEILSLVDSTITGAVIEEAIRAVSRGLNLPKFLQPDRIKVDVPIFGMLPGKKENLPFRLSLGKYIDDEGLYLGYVISSDRMEGGSIEIAHNVDFLSRLFNLPKGGEYIRVRQMLPLGRETIITLERQVRFQ